MRARWLGIAVPTVLALAACATARPVASDALFAGQLLDIRAPASAGWQMVHSNADGVAFGRADRATGRSYVAHVTAFAAPPFGTSDEFLAIVKAGVEQDTPPDRFRNVESSFRLTGERPYICVRLRATSEDMTARGGAALPLHVRSLYCQHPTKPRLGFVVGYSQRGGTPDPDLDQQADAFIAGVQIPAPK